MKIYWTMLIALGLSNSVFASDDHNSKGGEAGWCEKFLNEKDKVSQNLKKNLVVNCEKLRKCLNDISESSLKNAIPAELKPTPLKQFGKVGVAVYFAKQAFEYSCPQDENK